MAWQGSGPGFMHQPDERGAGLGPAGGQQQQQGYYPQYRHDPQNSHNNNNMNEPPFLYAGYDNQPAYDDGYDGGQGGATPGGFHDPDTAGAGQYGQHQYAQGWSGRNSPSQGQHLPPGAGTGHAGPGHGHGPTDDDANNMLGVPPQNPNYLPPGGGAPLYPSYTNDSTTDVDRWANVNPFATPLGGPPNHPLGGGGGAGTPGGVGNDDVPLLNQPGRYRNLANAGPGGYMPMMSAGGFVDPVSQTDPDDDEQSQVRYGRIPQRIPRRLKTVKQVALFRGNLVLDVPVPKKLLEQCPLNTDREFTRMRYTACTSDPDDFLQEKYALRQVLMEPPRQTELMIVMTMYNEGEDLYARTMYGVQKNIQHFCSRTRSKMWGKDAWKKIVVVLVSDGRQKVNSRTLSALACQGVYQDGVAKNVVNGKPVTCHIYEYTTQIAITPNMSYKGAESGIVPVQMIFALKEKNQKKINSHRWFFNAFARVLNPNVCVLIDVGTQPGNTSIYHLWKAFDTNSNVGGACGEIVTMKGKYLQSLLNPLVAAQNFEYKMSNILDKPLESVFGYITVLPGAFSAYRWHALQNDSVGNGPLAEYFKGEVLENKVDADLLTKNMYLAEDRVLCWELVSKRQSAWVLHYVKSAYGVTDTPDTVPELISQRRRWLNGSFFAAIHATIKFGYLYRSHHSFLRKFFLHIELIYQIIQQLFAWFGLANYFIAFSVLTNALNMYKWARIVSSVLHYVYLALLVMCFLLAMGNKPQGGRKMYTFAMVFFAVLVVYMTFCAIFLVVKSIRAVEGQPFKQLITDTNFLNIVVSMAATYGLWLYASIIFFDPWHMFTSMIQYLLLSPSYLNVLSVYALCNTHDVSWGTKGSTTVATDLGVVKASGPEKDKVDVDIPKDEKDIDAAYEDARHVLAQKAPKSMKSDPNPVERAADSFANIRTNVVLVWALSNAALVAAIIGSGASRDIEITDTAGDIQGTVAKVSIYLAILLWTVAGLAAVKAVGATIYMVLWLFQG